MDSESKKEPDTLRVTARHSVDPLLTSEERDIGEYVMRRMGQTGMPVDRKTIEGYRLGVQNSLEVGFPMIKGESPFSRVRPYMTLTIPKTNDEIELAITRCGYSVHKRPDTLVDTLGNRLPRRLGREPVDAPADASRKVIDERVQQMTQWNFALYLLSVLRQTLRSYVCQFEPELRVTYFNRPHFCVVQHEVSNVAEINSLINGTPIITYGMRVSYDKETTDRSEMATIARHWATVNGLSTQMFWRHKMRQALGGMIQNIWASPSDFLWHYKDQVTPWPKVEFIPGQ